MSHTFNVGMMQSGYRFGATFIGYKTLSPAEVCTSSEHRAALLHSSQFCYIFDTFQAYPIVLGEIDPSGNLNAQIIHMFGKSLRSRLIAQVS